MNEARRRETARRAVRNRIRELGKNPAHVSAKDAYVILDEMAREGCWAAQWYRKAKEWSLRLWLREWKSWANYEVKQERDNYFAKKAAEKIGAIQK